MYGNTKQSHKNKYKLVSILLPKIPFSTSIGTNPERNIETSLLRQLDEPNKIISALKIKLNKKFIKKKIEKDYKFKHS